MHFVWGVDCRLVYRFRVVFALIVFDLWLFVTGIVLLGCYLCFCVLFADCYLHLRFESGVDLGLQCLLPMFLLLVGFEFTRYLLV